MLALPNTPDTTFHICSRVGPSHEAHIRSTIETAFQKPLPEDYFQIPLLACIHTSDYRGVALLRKVGRWTYLDKLAVVDQGRGIGTYLLSLSMRMSTIWGYEAIFWRSREERTAWYLRLPGISAARFPQWTICWSGHLDASGLETAAEYAHSMPVL